jgi:hypothetical protein
MNLLKRATLVTLVAGSGLIFATTGAAAAAITPDLVTDQNQSGVQGEDQVGQFGYQGAKENEQTGDQGTKATDQSGDQGQSGQQGQVGDGANDQSGAQGNSGE